MSNIRLSPKHGVNPTIPVCAWCGEHKNEIVFLGKIKTNKRGEDPEAPVNCIMDYEPCDACREKFAKGVVAIEVTASPVIENQPPISVQGGQEVYPTGRWCVLQMESAERIFSRTFELGDKICLEDIVYRQLFEKRC